jgi:hypothetical protein
MREGKRGGSRAVASNIEEFVNRLHQIHLYNAEHQYLAERRGGPRRRPMSIVRQIPFIFEYFLFNSLYNVDWSNSMEKGKMAFHSNMREHDQQKALIEFIWSRKEGLFKNFCRAFLPLSFYPEAVGPWTIVTPDERISISHGRDFFSRISHLQSVIKNAESGDDITVIDEIGLIKECTRYIYLARNNIFHGTKTLTDIYDENQEKRIEMYELFLKSLTSLFFLFMGKTPVASDFFAPPTVASEWISKVKGAFLLDQKAVQYAINSGVMKNGDTRVIAEFFCKIKPPPQQPGERSALFYPSAGADLLTPLLMGIPYCRQFFFYDVHPNVQRRSISALNKILSQIPKVRVDGGDFINRWRTSEHLDCLKFKFDDAEKIICLVHLNNVDFLKQDVDLAFYFHRGDSPGEGGSGQRWDSEWLPKLISMIPSGSYCVYLTDGEPGGIDATVLKNRLELITPFVERNRNYYCGTLRSM